LYRRDEVDGALRRTAVVVQRVTSPSGLLLAPCTSGEQKPDVNFGK